MQASLVKPTKRNKCDYCDDLATYKIKKNDEPTLYMCSGCYKDMSKGKLHKN